MLDFKYFTEELKKQRIKVDLNKLYDFIDIYKREKNAISELKKNIDLIDSEIDTLVCKLLNLSNTEIQLIVPQVFRK